MPIALPLRAYNLIWNEWYRDQDLQNSLTVDTGDGPDTTAYALQRRNRRKDYFSSARPWPQKGNAVTIPIGGTAPISYLNPSHNATRVLNPTTGNPYGTNQALYQAVAGNMFNDAVGNPPVAVDLNGTHIADLDAASAQVTINALRQAIVLQQILELDARTGTRYVEALLARFGAVSPDFRLQRPEYVGGQTVDINVNPVAQTAATDATSPQGNLAAFAVGRGKAPLHYSASEHGQFLVLMSIRADTTYQQGLRRDWSVRTRYDYYEPLQANLGESPILNKEMLLKGDSTDNDAWGYQEMWADQRYYPGYVTGAFRSNYTGTLDSWHLALDQGSTRTSLSSLLPESPPVARIVAVEDEPHFNVDTWNRLKHTRVMPVYSAPGLFRL